MSTAFTDNSTKLLADLNFNVMALFARPQRPLCLLALASVSMVCLPVRQVHAATLTVSEKFKNIERPLNFEPNQGQADPSVRFLAHVNDGGVLLTENSAVFVSTKTRHRLEMGIERSDPKVTVRGDDKQPGRVNYLLGSDAKRWHPDIPTYGRVRYQGVYPGTDLIFYGSNHSLEYDFVLGAGCDPSGIQLRFSSPDKEIDLKQSETGDLLVSGTSETVVLRKPILYQKEGHEKQFIPGGYAIQKNGRVKFWIGPYDHKLALTIDPVLAFSTYLSEAPTASDVITLSGVAGIAVDPSGNVYTAGLAINLPTVNAIYPKPISNSDHGCFDLFPSYVAKFDPSGRHLLYATYLGNTCDGQVSGLAVDWRGRAYLTGYANNGLFPIVNEIQSAPPTGSFVAVLSESGSRLLFSSYLGGRGTVTTSIAVDDDEHVFLGGFTFDESFPTTPDAMRSSCADPGSPSSCGGTGFLTKLDPIAGKLLYSTFFGSNSVNSYLMDKVNGVATYRDGSVFIAGAATTSDFPILHSLFPSIPVTPPNGSPNTTEKAFLAKFDRNMKLVFSTLYGGVTGAGNVDGIEGYQTKATAVAVDAYGNPFIAGVTATTDLPLIHPFLRKIPPSYDKLATFVAKFTPNGSCLAYSTYVTTIPQGIQVELAVDAQGQATIVGAGQVIVDAGQLPLKDPLPVQLGEGSGAYGFITRLDSSGSRLVFSSYFAQQESLRIQDSIMHAVRNDILGNILTGGMTNGSTPLKNAFNSDPPGDFTTYKSFVAKIMSPPNVGASNLRSFVEGFSRASLPAEDIRCVLRELEAENINEALTILDRFDADVATLVNNRTWAIHTGVQLHEASRQLREQINIYPNY